MESKNKIKSNKFKIIDVVCAFARYKREFLRFHRHRLHRMYR